MWSSGAFQSGSESPQATKTPALHSGPVRLRAAVWTAFGRMAPRCAHIRAQLSPVAAPHSIRASEGGAAAPLPLQFSPACVASSAARCYTKYMHALLPALGQWPEFSDFAQNLRRDGYRGHVEGLTGAAKGCIIAGLAARAERPLLIITYNNEQAEQLYDDIVSFTGSAPDQHVSPEPAERVSFLPSLEILLYEEFSPDFDIIRDRLNSLHRLLRGEPVTVVATAPAVLHQTVPPAVLARAHLVLRKGQPLDLTDLAARLTGLGYAREEMVEHPAQFSIRGDIVDIYPSTTLQPLRLELFGDEVERLCNLDVETQRSTGEIPEFDLLPAQELVLEASLGGAGDPARAEQMMTVALREQLAILEQQGRPDAARRLRDKVEHDLERMSQGTYFQGVEYYLPFLHEGAFTALDYLPAGAAVVIDEPSLIAEHYERFEHELAQAYRLRLQDGSLLPLPDPLYLPSSEGKQRLRDRPTLSFSLLEPDDNGFWPGSPQTKVSLDPSPVPRFGARPAELADVLRGWQRDHQRVIISTLQGERLAELLAEAGVSGIVRDEAGAVEPGQVLITPRKISEGFALPEAGLVCLTDQEVFGWQKIRRSLRRRHLEGAPISSLTELAPGDYVVHINHGIGVYEGLVRRVVDTAEREYMSVHYAGEDRLYVPIDQLDRVQKYIGSEDQLPAVHRLGGADWERAKRRAKRSARELARELVALYAARQSQPGHAFSPDAPWQQEMEVGFPYEETADQLAAIADVKSDMERPKPTDRLVCGDVGYGKTEVAIRACFKAVMDGKQAAVLVPTTVLAQQHFSTFSERLAPYPLRVEMLSRFRSRVEQKRVVEGLADGTVDIVIGTHRLLSRDVEFKDLGLVVVDEEQRFGVRHKEKLKQLRTIVDVLTLTATPIPRTLHMSLSGIRDMSVINEPPEGRLPIRTRALSRDDEVVREALLRELERGGQVYFVHNRVESIGHVAEHVRQLVPHARIAIGHGQLREADLERVMLDFYAGKHDILVCTTIIESGLDIPNVNTLVVDRADLFGLAQLYQLRGRVGRSNRQAYAYLMWTPHKRLTERAQKRIAAIKEFSHLGSGFRIALRDLEIRGAGNLLGPEQHGFMLSVGFELYTQMLAEAVQEVKGEPVPTARQVSLDLPVDAYLPEDYVPSLNQRIDFYRRMAAVRNAAQMEDLREELADRFGAPLPPQVDGLFRLIQLKLDCLAVGVAGITSERRQVTIRFAPDRRLTSVAQRKLQGQFSAVRDREFRQASPVASHDRIELLTLGLSPQQLLALSSEIVLHAGRMLSRVEREQTGADA
ncbi:MAG: transcription-repair coupling factor [Armatimonadota bacterium]|nr:MAG: transcription-repair coupling factor [Armatimonadota bacterium]